MELILNKEEVEKVLLDYARTLLDARFNTVASKSYYGLGDVTFSYVEPKDEAQ
jgi:hypothetical protein